MLVSALELVVMINTIGTLDCLFASMNAFTISRIRVLSESFTDGISSIRIMDESFVLCCRFRDLLCLVFLVLLFTTGVRVNAGLDVRVFNHDRNDFSFDSYVILGPLS